MSATPRSARLSSPGEVVAILVASALIWLALVGTLIALFFTVFIPAVTFGGKGDIPSDFPVYPGAQLESAFATDSNGCITVDATWSTADDAATVTSFYQRVLATGSWTVFVSKQNPGEVDIYFASRSGLHREGYVAVRSSPFSQISLVMYKSKAHAGANCRVAYTVGPP